MKPAGKATTGKQTATWMFAVLVLAMTAPCLAQSSSSQNASKLSATQRRPRLVLVSIADRRLAVIEDGDVLAYFPVAVEIGRAHV